MSDYPKILYVEDDAMSRVVVEILLKEQMGLSHVVIWPDSNDFTANIAAMPFVPDVILLDIHMKPLNGFEMLDILRQHPVYRQHPIVALTASVMNEEVDKLREAGFNGVLAKPLNERAFPLMLERILSGEYVWSVL